MLQHRHIIISPTTGNKLMSSHYAHCLIHVGQDHETPEVKPEYTIWGAIVIE